jgi:hypothetical protein
VRTPCDTATGDTPAALNTGAVQPSAGAHTRARARTAGAAPSDTPTGKHRRARKGEWEAAYFDALTRGHVKASAASIAGVSERAVYKRAKEDAEFAERECIAYHLGSAALMKIALERVRDPVRPSDTILIHLLSVREADHKRVVQHTPPDRGSVEAEDMIPFDKLSLETRRRIVAELEAIERGSSSATGIQQHFPFDRA